MAEKFFLDESGLRVLVSNIKSEDAATLTSAKGYTDTEIGKLATVASTGAAADVSIADAEGKFTATDVEGALAELVAAIEGAESAGEVTITTDTTTEGYLKSYTFTQNDKTIGVVDIPKDLVVTSGEVVVNPEGQPAGTYLKLVIANQTNPIYINVADLVDVYTAAQGAAQVQLAISATNEISATIVAGSVSSTELAADAVVTAKIADKNVTKAKLEQSVQDSLDLADSAIQEVVTGSANGTIAVDGADVAVKGLDSAAYAKTTDFDAAGAAAAVQGATTETVASVDAKIAALDTYTAITADEINKMFE